jgi:hypothetical protein
MMMMIFFCKESNSVTLPSVLNHEKIILGVINVKLLSLFKFITERVL